jgi:hypothetical protein
MQQETVARPVRTFLQKVSKTIDHIEWKSTEKDLVIAAQRAQIEDLQQRRKKRQTIDCNETFANIETIRLAKQAVAALPARRTTTRRPTEAVEARNVTINDPQSAYMHVFSIHPIVVDE